MKPNSENSTKQLEDNSPSHNLGIKNDNSNPQQGNGTKFLERSSSENERTDVSRQSSFNRVDPCKKEERKLFVGGLPEHVRDAEFRVFFDQYGPVLDSIVMINRETRRSRGFGFVTFENVATAHAVLGGEEKTKNMVTIHGKECEVKLSVPKRFFEYRRHDRKMKKQDGRDHSLHMKNNDEKSHEKGEDSVNASRASEENLHRGMNGEVNNQIGPSFDSSVIHQFQTYQNPYGSIPGPAYEGSGGMMYPSPVVPHFTPAAPMQNEFYHQNSPAPYYYGYGYETNPYFQNQVTQPFIPYPPPYSQMMYPYMTTPQQYPGTMENEHTQLKEDKKGHESNESIPKE